MLPYTVPMLQEALARLRSALAVLWRCMRFNANARARNEAVRKMLKATPKGLTLRDERGRAMAFPRRQDYVGQLSQHGFISSEADFVASDRLTEAVYLDWLFRPQVGCVFAQLLARPVHRAGVRTVVARGRSGIGDPSELAAQIAGLVTDAVEDESTEALSVLLPQILDLEPLARLTWALGHHPGWFIEQERPWRKTLMLIGLRVEIASGVVAETLGMGPFPLFPPTRQCPVTTLEIRTKPRRAKKSHLSRTHLAAHLADIRTEHVLRPAEFRARRQVFTPWLRKRILGAEDFRAKAGVTYSFPAPIWSSLKGASP